MITQNIFKYAAKKSLRFPYKGLICTEDLFDLDMNALDLIYKTLKKQQKASDEESLIDEKTAEDTELEVKLAIVKEIFNDKKLAAEKAKKAFEKRIQKQKILDIMSRKQDEELNSKSLEELQAELDKFDADDADEET